MNRQSAHSVQRHRGQRVVKNRGRGMETAGGSFVDVAEATTTATPPSGGSRRRNPVQAPTNATPDRGLQNGHSAIGKPAHRAKG